jgi:hypothetical protein
MLVGYGALLVRLALGRERLAEMGIGELALAGFLPLGWIAIAANFSMPLGATVSALVLVGGWLALVMHRRHLRLPCRATLLAAVVLALGLIFAGGAFVNGLLYDTGLYHFQTILWQHDSPVVLGLANLHGRLGFNTMWHSICAVLWLPGLGSRGAFSVNSALGAVFFLFLVEPFLRRDVAASQLPGLRFLTLMFFALPGGPGFGKGLMFSALGSPDADMPAMVFTTAAFLLACCGPASRWLLLLVVALLAVTTKLAALPVLLLPVWLAASNRRDLARGALVACVTVGLWTLRSLCLSGCLVYPSSLTCLPGLPWSVSLAQADYEALLIRSWARAQGPLPEQVLGSWAWLPEWWARFAAEAMTRLLFACALAGAMLRLLARPIRRALGTQIDRPTVWHCVLVGLLGLAFCFALAPSPRFAYGFLVMTPLLCLYMGLVASGLASHLRRLSRPLLLLALLSLSPSLLRASRELLLHPLAPWPLVPSVATRENRNWQGHAIFTPLSRDQCWGAPRPCAVIFDPRLTLGRLGLWPLMRGRHKDSETP